MKARIREKAFHPNAAQQGLHISEEVFTLVRTSVDKKERILAITNIADKVQGFSIGAKQIGGQTDFTCRDNPVGQRFCIHRRNAFPEPDALRGPLVEMPLNFLVRIRNFSPCSAIYSVVISMD